jgi:acyl-CoA thioester hydrolase
VSERYGHHVVVPTRWNDNDQYGHVNNAVYYEAMDTTINTWLVQAGLDPLGGSHIAVCASSSCEFRASVSFPQAMVVGLRAGRVGTTSVTWELGISAAPAPGQVPHAPDEVTEPGQVPAPDQLAPSDQLAEPDQPAAPDQLAATGRFVHVFVDAATRRPTPIPDALRAAIERDLVVPS